MESVTMVKASAARTTLAWFTGYLQVGLGLSSPGSCCGDTARATGSPPDRGSSPSAPDRIGHRAQAQWRRCGDLRIWLWQVGHQAPQVPGHPCAQRHGEPFVQLRAREPALGEVVAEAGHDPFPVTV